jgi:hypothetical protein
MGPRWGMPTDEKGPEVLPVVPEAAGSDDALPVVARLVVEIRSDGRRTIARGALDDQVTGQRVAVHVDDASPLALARSLARAIRSLPALLRTRRRRKALRR